LPFSSLIPKYELLECKSKAAYNLIRHLLRLRVMSFLEHTAKRYAQEVPSI
jgi:hypothetical protein